MERNKISAPFIVNAPLIHTERGDYFPIKEQNIETVKQILLAVNSILSSKSKLIDNLLLDDDYSLEYNDNPDFEQFFVQSHISINTMGYVSEMDAYCLKAMYPTVLHLLYKNDRGQITLHFDKLGNLCKGSINIHPFVIAFELLKGELKITRIIDYRKKDTNCRVYNAKTNIISI